MINNRQAGRRRGRGGQQQRSQGGGNPGRLDTGNRIDNRARGNAAQLLEKYKTLARDAQMQGDRVNVEYYLQFADHYFRVLAETRARIEENGGPVQRRIQGATLDEDDTEFEDEGERVAPAEQQRGNPNGQNGYRQDGRQDGRQDSRSDGDRSDGNRQESRSDSGRSDGNRNDSRNEQRGDGDRGYQRGGNRANGDQQNGASEVRGDTRGEARNDAPAERPRRSQNGGGQDDSGYDRQRDQQRDAPRGTADRYARTDSRADSRTHSSEEESRQDTPVSEVSPVTTEQAATVQSDTAEPPRRGRGRPRRDAATTPAAPVSEAKDESADDNSFSADLLPPSLNVSAVVSDDSEADAVEKPRRRRGRPPIVRETDPVA